MNNDAENTGEHRGVRGATEWLEGKLYRVLGPPQLGPYDAEPLEVGTDGECPLCHQHMSEHRVEKEDDRTYLHCPTDDVDDIVATGRTD